MTKPFKFIGVLLFLFSIAGIVQADNVGGTLTANTVWSPALGTVTVLPTTVAALIAPYRMLSL